LASQPWLVAHETRKPDARDRGVTGRRRSAAIDGRHNATVFNATGDIKMFRTITLAALTAAALFTSVHSASAWVLMNGAGENGTGNNGHSTQGYSTQGLSQQGVATQGTVSTGITVLSIEVPRAE
jgi:hypothetical protein